MLKGTWVSLPILKGWSLTLSESQRILLLSVSSEININRFWLTEYLIKRKFLHNTQNQEEQRKEKRVELTRTKWNKKDITKMATVRFAPDLPRKEGSKGCRRYQDFVIEGLTSFFYRSVKYECNCYHGNRMQNRSVNLRFSIQRGGIV